MINPFSLFRKSQIETRVYQAASTGRRVENWRTSNSDANAEISSANQPLRNRARDLTRNNPYAKRIVSAISTGIVGTGILPGSESSEYLKVFNTWADSTDCDFNEKLNFYGLQQLIVECLVESGECLILKHYDKQKKIPLQLKVLEPDYIDTSKTGNNIIQGIQYSNDGKITGYWLFSSHPGSLTATSNSTLIPASSIIHLFRQDRPGQNRGISWLAPVMIKIKKLEEYQDAMLERHAISNLLTGFIYDQNADAIPSNEQSKITLEPGAMITLPPNKDIRFSNPPDPGNPTYYFSSILHAIAVGVGISHESLTGDYSQSNFSSARMANIDFGKNIDSWRYNLIIPVLLDQIANWFYEILDISGIYNKEKPVIKWTPPRRQLLDPGREIPPIIEAVRAGLMTLSEAIREQGYTKDEFLKEYASDIESLDKLGIILSTDVRQDAKRIQATSYYDYLKEKD